MSSSVSQFSRGPHSTRRLNNLARTKIATYHPNLTIASTDLNSQSNNSNSTNAVLAHYEHSHADTLLEALNDLRLNRHLCDVTIVVDQQQFPCHKVNLFRLSVYLNSTSFLISSRTFLLPLVPIFVRCLQHPKCVNHLKIM